MLSRVNERGEPNWQPIGMLPTIAAVVTEMVDGAAEQQRLLTGARPYSLDNATLDRVEQVYRDGAADNGVFEQQVARWQREHPDAEGLAELAATVAELGPAYQRVLDLAAQQRAEGGDLPWFAVGLAVGVDEPTPVQAQSHEVAGHGAAADGDAVVVEFERDPRSRPLLGAA
jgi:hypothetical protein